MTAQPDAPAPTHLLSLPSANELDVARILGLPALPDGNAGIEQAYRDLSAKGTVLFVSGVAIAADNLVPNSPVDIPNWARDHLRLPAAQSQRSGPLVMSPLQAAICRLWATKRRVTFLKPPRFKSTLIMVVGLTYHAGHLGVDVLFYERTEGDAQDFHDKKLYPILTESPALAHLIRANSRSGIQDAWMDRILTTGASIQLRGVSTNGSMRGIKGLFIGVDEASSAEYQAGTKGEKGEGSKLALIIKRAQEFFDPCVYVGGTPTVVGSCITSKEYEKGDQCLFMMRSRCCPDLAQEFWDDRHGADRPARRRRRPGGRQGRQGRTRRTARPRPRGGRARGDRPGRRAVLLPPALPRRHGEPQSPDSPSQRRHQRVGSRPAAGRRGLHRPPGPLRPGADLAPQADVRPPCAYYAVDI